jgi:hypothetical protein
VKIQGLAKISLKSAFFAWWEVKDNQVQKHSLKVSIKVQPKYSE